MVEFTGIPLKVAEYVLEHRSNPLYLVYRYQLCVYPWTSFSSGIREAAKKVLFLVARPLRLLAPPPLGLVALGTFFLTLKISSFFLSGTPV